MAEITDSGVIPKTLTEYQTDLRAAFQAAFGADIDLGPKSPQGQFIDILALSLSQNDDSIVSMAGAIRIFSAFGSQLEGLASLLGINKRAAESTIVSADLGGTPGTIIPAGSRAKSAAGDMFELDEETQLDLSGTASASMSAVETGPIELGAGELTSVVDVIPGWETVNNPAAGVTGRDVESDSEYRQRYFIELFRNALSVLDSIIAAVSEVESVSEVRGEENDTGSPIIVQNVTIDAHSVALVVEGGLDEDIKDAIRLKKTGGTGTTGTTSVPDPPHQDINFFRPSYINPEVTVTTAPGPNFPPDGVSLLKNRIFEYVNGGLDLEAGQNYFETDGMTISEDLAKSRLYTPINSVSGHIVSSLMLEDKASPGDVAILTANLDEKIKFDSLDDINIVLV